MQSDKVGNKNGSRVNEITKNLTTVMTRIQDSDQNLKKGLENVKIENASEIQVDNNKRCYLVQVNESSVKNLQSVHGDVVKKLEDHFSTPVVIVPARKKINGKLYQRYNGSKVPRHQTLSAVNDALLEDLLYPATIIGKRTRFPKGKSRVFKVYVDPLDKETIEYKTNAIAACYKGLTNRDLVIEFPTHA